LKDESFARCSAVSLKKQGGEKNTVIPSYSQGSASMDSINHRQKIFRRKIS
jgi:hypothetical protein